MSDFILGAFAVCDSCRYHHTIAGEVITAVVCSIALFIALWIAYRNFVQGRSTAAEA